MNAKAGRKEEISVTKDDQANINAFSWLNTKFHEMSKDIKSKHEMLEQNDDALTEIELVDDESDLRLKFGECFFRADADTCKEYIENFTTELKTSSAGLQSTIDENRKKMNKLKSVLYSKFGNSINLEED